jgi:hypothetical protein
MPNYKEGKIYLLRSFQTDDVYIGSTCQSLAKRKGQHKGDYKRHSETSRYVSSFKLCQYEDMYIELLEEYPCESKEQLHRKEGMFIRDLECVNKEGPVEKYSKEVICAYKRWLEER